jgi:hypothetical protein
MSFFRSRKAKNENAGKQVYLPAFDSVRNTKEEIEYAQRRFYQLIVYEGMTVVLTLNQLTDSIAFLCMLRDPECYQKLMELFEMGVVKVSRYGDMPSAASFVKSRLKKCLDAADSQFIFSALPIRSTGDANDLELIQAMYQSLDASDPGCLREFLKSQAGKDRLSHEDAQLLLRYIQMLLRISMEELAANPRKVEKGMSQEEYLLRLMEMREEEAKPYCVQAGLTIDQWVAVQRCLRADYEKLREAKASANSRSNWYILLKAQYDEHPEYRDQLARAEGVVDFCYNMCMEDSIYQISTYYEPGDQSMQLRQMFQQLGHYLDPRKNHGHHFLRGDEKVQVWPKQVKLADLSTAVRILKNTNARERDCSGISVAENKADYQRQWGKAFSKSLRYRFMQLVLSIAIFVLCEYVINLLQDRFQGFGVLFTILQLLLFSASETIFLQALERKLGVDDLDAFYLLKSIPDWGRDMWSYGYARKRYFRERDQGNYVL